MVKIENNLEDKIYRILLRPNQSSDWKSSLIFILIIAFTCLSIGIGFALAGATMILPFAGLEILFVGVCVYLVMKNTYKQEVITLTKETLKIEKGQDIFERGYTLKKVDFDSSFPKYILENKDKLKKWIA